MTAPTLPPQKPRPDGEYINSLARGLSVLRAFTKQRPEMTLSEVASATNLNPAVARRCLNTLEHLGYICRKGKLFLLTPEVMSFATAYIESMNLQEVVRPYLQAVRDQSGDSSSLSVLMGEEVLYLVHVSTSRMIRLDAGVGTRFPVYPTSMGRILMAYQNKDLREAYLRNAHIKTLTDKTITSVTKLRSIFSKARKDGYASVENELDYGIVSVAVPVLDVDNDILAAINCSTSTARISQQEMVRTRLPILQKAAQEIEIELRRYPILAHSVGH